MSKKRADVEAVIRDFAEALKEQGLKVDKIILFGSQARGDARGDSDIDLLVVSPDFGKMSFLKRMEILGTAIAKVRKPIEPLACTPDEVQIEKLSKASFLYDVLARQETLEYRV
ncbi:MAG: nucleotidyltransferase domain-containing protein [Moorellaceae bacterium]